VKMILKRNLNLGFGTLGMRVWSAKAPGKASHCSTCGRFIGEDDFQWGLGNVEVCRCWRHLPTVVANDAADQYTQDQRLLTLYEEK
jgi:hypothetical protein